MDNFEDEFSLISTNDKLKALDSIIFSQEEFIKNTKRKLYIFKVLALTEEIKELYEKDKSAYKEATIRISKYFDWDFGWILRTGVRLSDRYQYHNPTSEVRSIFQRLESIKIYDQDYASKDLLPNVEFYFDFSESEKLKKMLLAENTLKTLDYYNLRSSLKPSRKSFPTTKI